MTSASDAPTSTSRRAASVVGRAVAGACAGACLIALLVASGVPERWLGPHVPPPDLLPWTLRDVVDDRMDHVIYRLGCILAAALGGLWCWVGARRAVGRPFVALPVAGLLLGCGPWMLKMAPLAPAVTALGVLLCAVALVLGLRAPTAPDAASALPSSLPARHPLGWADAVVVFVLAAVLVERAPATLAGALLREDHFFHWDVFAMGPAVAARGGWSLGTDVPLIYGLGPPTVLARLAEWTGAFDHAHVLRVAGWIEVLYFLGFYAALRAIGLRAGVAAFVLAVGVSIERFRLVPFPPHDLMRYPSSSVLRFLFDAPWLLLVAFHERTRRMIALALAGTAATLAVGWVTDTGLCLLLAHIGYVAVVAWHARSDGDPAWRRLLVHGLAPVFVGAVVAVVAVGGDVSTLSSNFLDQIALRAGGYAVFPMPALDLESAILYATPFLFVVLGVIAVARRAPDSAVAAAWAVYSLGAYHYYVGRSVPANWCRLGVVTVVACLLLVRLVRSGDPDSGVGRSARSGALRRWWPVVAAVAVLVATPRALRRMADIGFAGVPDSGSETAPRREIPPGTDPAITAAVASGMDSIRALVPPGEPVALVSDLDVLYCLGSDRRPLSPRIPLLHMTLTHAQFDDACARFDDPAVRYVFIDATRAEFHWSSDLVPAFRAHVAKSFEFVERVGDLNVWRRRGDR